MQNKPHPHKDLIIAWANGAEIEGRYGAEWSCEQGDNPHWYSHYQYRIKPAEPPKAEWIFCNGKRPEGIPDGTKILWYSPKNRSSTPVMIELVLFGRGRCDDPILFIKIADED